MTHFICQSACRGQRPARAAAPRCHTRAAQVALLARHRRCVRFLAAPAGFGKAMLAAEYAETMFGFRHVFWINATSPCFLRDVDEGVVHAAVKAADAEASLVVFADVPLLDEERAGLVAELLENLIADGIEVIATTTPASDSVSALVPDALVVNGAQLLLDEAEAAGAFLPERRAERVACLVWSPEGAATLVGGCARDEMPADMRAALWSMLVMGRGRKGDLRALLGVDRGDEAWEYLERSYPFLGIDADEGTFQTASLDLGLVARSFGSAMEPMARALGCARRGDAASLLADRLRAAGDAVRAAALMGAVAPRATVGAWLGRCGWELVSQGAAGQVVRLYELSCRTKLAERFSINAMVACAHAQLGHRARALEFARKVTSATLAPSSLKAVAALCAYRQGNAEVRRRMGELLGEWLETRTGAEDAVGQAGGVEAALALLAKLSCAPASKDAVSLCRDGLARVGATAVAPEFAQGYLLAAAWAIDAAAGDGAFSDDIREDFGFLARWALEAVEGCLEEGRPLGYGGEEAVLALDRRAISQGQGDGPCPSQALVDAAVSARGERMRVDEAAAAEVPVALPVGTGGRPLRRPAMPQALPPRPTPLLEVRLFGGVRVFIGGREVSPRLLASRRSRALLTLLVLHRGCELAREDLVRMLWPHADMRTGRKSFYRLWQNLQAALAVEGTCPYLVRDRYGCRLDPALFTSDVMEFEDTVRQLLFGSTALVGSWERLYEQVRTMFSGKLAPCETGNEVVDGFRERYALELIDGLVAASVRLRAAGEPQGALWFARAALERDASREDAYAALMEAQLGAGQRSGAVETYHACRRHLADSLGLDPSRQLGALYQRVIEDEPPMLVGAAAGGSLCNELDTRRALENGYHG